MRNLIIRWIILALAIALTDRLLKGMHVSGGILAYIWVAALFGLVNAILGPILRLVALPITILTLGFFALIVNGTLLAIVAGVSSHLSIDHFFWTAVLAALLISVFSAIMNLAFGGRRSRGRAWA